jgi:hypothetical protein
MMLLCTDEQAAAINALLPDCIRVTPVGGQIPAAIRNDADNYGPAMHLLAELPEAI